MANILLAVPTGLLARQNTTGAPASQRAAAAPPLHSDATATRYSAHIGRCTVKLPDYWRCQLYSGPIGPGVPNYIQANYSVQL